MRIFRKVVNLLAGTACLVLFAQAQPAQPAVDFAARFRQFDRDGDGKVSAEEAAPHTGVKRLLQLGDTDRDGALSIEEYQEVANRQGNRPAPMVPPSLVPRPQTAASLPVRDDFTVDDVPVSPPGRPFSDPEFNDGQHRVVYWDHAPSGKLNISVAELDPQTGLLKSATGSDYAVDQDVSPCFKEGRWWSHNGPEWGRDRDGWAIYYTKDDANGNRHLWRAVERDGRYVPEALTTTPGGHCGVLVTQDTTASDTRMLSYTDQDVPGKGTVAWAWASQPNAFHPLPDWRGSHSIARFVEGTDFIAYAPRDKAGVPQVVLLDTSTGRIRAITDEPGDKFDTFGFHAPEFGGELLVMSNIDRQRLAVYRDVDKDGGPWRKIAELRLPEDSPYKCIYSCEPIAPETGVNGVSYISLNATRTAGRNRGETGRTEKDGSIWVLGLGTESGNRMVRRVDEGAASGIRTTRYEAESMLGAEEVFVYYERRDPETGRGEVRRRARPRQWPSGRARRRRPARPRQPRCSGPAGRLRGGCSRPRWPWWRPGSRWRRAGSPPARRASSRNRWRPARPGGSRRRR